jgi:hypothetical protein
MASSRADPLPEGGARGGIPFAQLEPAFRAMLFVAIAVAGIAVAAATDAWWTTALAFAGVAFAIAGIMVSVARLADAEAQPGPARGRGRAIALAVVATAMLVLAVTVPEHVAARTPPASVAQAQDTVRGFLTTAVLADDAYLACQYLTPAEQQRVAQLAGRGATCQDAFVSSKPTFAGVQSEGQLKALPLRTAVHGDRADVVAQPPGGQPVTFGLRRATPAELDAFDAPQVPWRIDAGAEAVL